MSDTSVPIIGIFADDLTGALDAAAPFAVGGYRTVVSANWELPHGAADAEVVSINLGTRHMNPAEVAVRTSSAVSALAELGPQVMLNKIDSTLRGHPGVEIATALIELSADHAVLCSAYPQNDRVVENGILKVNGTPVAETDVGQDQLSPLLSSKVEEIVLESLELAGISERVHLRGNNDDRSVSDLLPVIIAVDAHTDNDLKILAERLIGAKVTAFVAGSAGVSVALAEVLGDSRSGRHLQIPPLTPVGRTLIVTASQRTIVDEQIKCLGDQINLAQVEISIDELVQGIGSTSMDRISGITARERVAVLRVGKLDSSAILADGDLQAMAEMIVCNLGQVVRTVTDTTIPDVLVVIGGDTTSGVLSACGVESLELQGELQPGTVSGVPANGSISDRLLITRAGGFGDKNALLELFSILEFGHGV